MFIQVLAQGNISQEDARLYFDTAATMLKADKHTDINIPDNCAMKVPDEGTKILRVDTFDPKDTNSIVLNEYQYGPGSLRDKTYLDVCRQLMSEPVFNILRTKEQLGYNVYSTYTLTNGILGMMIYVNSQVNSSI